MSRPRAALEGDTLNLAAELTGTGVTANVLRPGMVNTAMQAWIREQPSERVGTALHDWFVQMRESGMLLEPAEPARMIAELVATEANGEVVDARRAAVTRSGRTWLWCPVSPPAA
jgi:NAD(P)-dependent dehydrogenase (short-subunit alcohol dehydrogenase family)